MLNIFESIELSSCSKISYFENGAITYSLREQTLLAIHICHPGLFIRGNRELTCSSDGSWIGFVTPCGEYSYKSLSLDCDDCPDAIQVPFASITMRYLASGTIAEYNCLDGFMMSANSIVHCDLNSNTWPTKLIPKCGKFSVFTKFIEFLYINENLSH